MDKYEFKLKIDEMKALVSARNYNAAAEIAETINWRKIRNLNALVLAGEVFEQVGRYEESKEILLMAYDKSPIGRNIIYRLAEIAIKTKKFDEAQEYYDEFVDIAPHDNLKFVLKYKMTAAQGLPYKEQITILEELKEQEYSEEWAYELAYLYHKDMQPEKCVEACDELILWFGDGIYVEKALELKMHYQPLTKQQEEKYRMFRQKRTGVIEVKPNDFLESGEIVNKAVEIPSVETNMSQYNTANLQKEIAKGMQQIASVKMHKEEQVQEPNPAMSIEEIQVEWEKTKQAMQDALREAEEQKQESSKEKSLEKAEQLMERLLSIVPQLAEGIASKEYMEHPVESENLQPVEVQDDLEQASRIVAGMNQLLQEQIDNLSAEEEKKQAPVIHRVSDPTREMPQLPEDIIEDKENGAIEIEKEEMSGDSLQKVLMEEEDNPIMNAWKEAQPGISAIDLLQRVRVEQSAANTMQQMQAEKAAANTVPQMQDSNLNHSSQTAVRERQIDDRQTYSAENQNIEYGLAEQESNSDMNKNPKLRMDLQNNINNQRKGMVQYREHLILGQESADEQKYIENSTGVGQEYSKKTLETKLEYSAEHENMEMGQEYSSEYAETGQENFPEHAETNREYLSEYAEMGQENLSDYPEMKQEYSAEYAEMKQEYSPEYAEMKQEYSPVGQEYSAEYAQMGQEYSPVNNSEEYSFDQMSNSQEYLSGQMNNSQEYSSEYMDNRREYLPENRKIGIRGEYSLKNKGLNVEPEYEDEQRNRTLAVKPKFLTQAQLQAESVMDEKKSIQATKEFSKDAMTAAQTAGFYEKMPQAESQYMDEPKKLTLEQKQIFSYFVPISGMEAQIYDLLKGVSEHLQFDKHALFGNIIVEGIGGSGKTVLIMDIIKALQKEVKRPSGKIGKIDANALNQKDMDVLTEKVSGGCLIIESAGKISRETAVNLSRCMEKDHAGTLYILEDTEEGIQKALERDSSFAAKFTEKISIPLFSFDELVEFGKAYANDLNYDIDEMGVLALYKRIGNIQKIDHVTTLTEVKEIVDEAIENAEKGVLKKVFGILTATRANDDNYIILREKDFEE